MFEKVLIANRGEIAVRILRACREEGLRSVAVFSEADRRAPHAILADQAVEIGPAAAAESYLDIDRLLAAAQATGAEALHPGYGFLAESAELARRVEEAGLVFIGPPADAIDAMGDKTRARARMAAAGIPVVPGSEPVGSAEAAAEAATDVGYPVLLKAAAGGGGKGMRSAADEAELRTGFERATREAKSAFGDGRVYLERHLARPRHVEIQVLADEDRALHLGERECSIQRRHQKLIEEAPSPAIDGALRARMGEVAVRAAEAVSYRGAGTVEFLLDGEDFYFLEMNTRIQVEHPVTELVTGVDLVREQLAIAAGRPALSGAPAPPPRGHAIECRISAEDPRSGFLPSTGEIVGFEAPAGPGIRWDGGIRTGLEVGLHYDPLLGKLIVHASSREGAIRRMRAALEGLRVDGVETTIPFHLAVLDEPDFRRGELSIRYVEEHPELLAAKPRELGEAAMAIAVLCADRGHDGAEAVRSTGSGPGATGRVTLTPWRRALGGW
ncbi:MAG: acetyl-CoA carboxylase biotin carboxylase subunit [Gemmatimonadota bacterium]|nr:acetyl-CoA carboxylase biotin carboxylase subunit [Gemmatimonadota bacterium]